MTTQAQPTPDELIAENELICEKLLGWTRSRVNGYWFRDHGEHQSGLLTSTPTFHSWHHAGLILDALGKCAEFPRIGQRTSDLHWYCALKGGVATVRETAALAIRAAALEYIRSLP